MPQIVLLDRSRGRSNMAVLADDGAIAAYGHLEVDAIIGGPGTRLGDLTFVIDEGGQSAVDASALVHEAAEVSNVR